MKIAVRAFLSQFWGIWQSCLNGFYLYKLVTITPSQGAAFFCNLSPDNKIKPAVFALNYPHVVIKQASSGANTNQVRIVGMHGSARLGIPEII
jgi:hypothetical protein